MQFLKWSLCKHLSFLHALFPVMRIYKIMLYLRNLQLTTIFKLNGSYFGLRIPFHFEMLK